MQTLRIILILSMSLLLAGCLKETRVRQTSSSEPRTYVIVHGAWGGGWAFREVDDMLTVLGHKVYRPTLTGQGERVHLASLEVGLDTHIQDVVNTILFEELQDVVLIGHSYGGMVVTGVADRIPERIEHMIYLDAALPEDGESLVTRGSRSDNKPDWAKNSRDGFLVPSWIKPDQPYPRDVPHPVKTFTDTIVLKNPNRLRIPSSYILTVDPAKEAEKDGFFDSYQRAKALGWHVQQMQADHNPQWSAPKELAELFIKTPTLHQ